MEQADLLLIGLGDLGAVTLELLARVRGIEKIIVGSRSSERGVARCNLARIGAMAQGYSPDISFLELDLNHPDDTAQKVQEINPKIILCTASMMTWWLPSLFPADQQGQLKRTGFGAWLPLHLTPPLKLMEALKLADYDGFTLIAPYPDVVNPILKARGFKPTAGIGNLDEVVPKVRYLGAQRMGIDPDALKVTLVAHHALEAWVFGNERGDPPPYYLRVEHEGEDVTDLVEAEKILFETYPMSIGPAWHFLSAGCAVRLINALLSDKVSRLHVPGPDGLPGGYPIKVSAAGILLDLPDELSIDNAIAINEVSHQYDGIERIEADGTVVFGQETVEVLQDSLGFGQERMKPMEAEGYAKELIRRFRTFASRHNVEFPISAG